MRIIVDSSAWIEYLEGTKEGEKVRDLINNNEVFILTLMISEIISKVERKRANSEIAYDSLISNSKIIDLTPKMSKDAGILHAKMRQKIKDFGIVDAIILIAAKNLKAKILTKDNHFKSFKEIIFLN